ncbi:MAG: hypothetical protein E6Y91_06185 [Peptostreptococcus anaerobius]|uniref:hypothetical protein n=1 Tax=Peptostreptococcus sp. TaxID=1262 RepID=UPI00291132B0|nr:hypothetical protein [Peptostreptococcus sp.]MDU3423381.1 hypothetical protein [Peptostreptococcus anaerobius]MDU5987362.1 hypothetical protein [Peptostreptococcus anaerobius]
MHWLSLCSHSVLSPDSSGFGFDFLGLPLVFSSTLSTLKPPPNIFRSAVNLCFSTPDVEYSSFTFP